MHAPQAHQQRRTRKPPAGGISPVTRDYVNPEAPWPHLSALAQATAEAGFLLLPRLPVYPDFIGLRGPGGSARRVSGGGCVHCVSFV